jgi:uncharacterized protein YebE (UPF0316 family)
MNPAELIAAATIVTLAGPGAAQPGALEVIATSILIVLARIGDVSLGTVRTVAVINGRRWLSWVLGFFEVLLWIVVVSRVIQTIGESPLYPIAYALGFATGNFIGITIENHVAYGEQVVRIFSRRGAALATILRERGFRVTEFEGRGRDGPVEMLFIETRRKTVPAALAAARNIDPECFYVVDDVRVASARYAEQQPGGWRSILKRK